MFDPFNKHIYNESSRLGRKSNDWVLEEVQNKDLRLESKSNASSNTSSTMSNLSTLAKIPALITVVAAVTIITAILNISLNISLNYINIGFDKISYELYLEEYENPYTIEIIGDNFIYEKQTTDEIFTDEVFNLTPNTEYVIRVKTTIDNNNKVVKEIIFETNEVPNKINLPKVLVSIANYEFNYDNNSLLINFKKEDKHNYITKYKYEVINNDIVKETKIADVFEETYDINLNDYDNGIITINIYVESNLITMDEGFNKVSVYKINY